MATTKGLGAKSSNKKVVAKKTTRQGTVGVGTPWMDVAIAEIGTREVVGGEHNARIVEYHQCTTFKATADEVPWCASFVCWCLQQAGMKHTHSAAAKSYADYGTQVNSQDLRYGCVVVLRRVGGFHVGFVMRREGDNIVVLGGNQSDQVKLSTYPMSKIVALRWPEAA